MEAQFCCFRKRRASALWGSTMKRCLKAGAQVRSDGTMRVNQLNLKHAHKKKNRNER